MTLLKTMLAFHSDPKIKAKYLRRVRAHAKADQIVKGRYWEDGKGCAVGCTIHGDNHAAYETELGIPKEIAHLEDFLFERLENGDALSWPERFLAAIKPGTDLSKVYARFQHWLLVDEKDGVIRFAKGDGIKAIRDVGALWERVARGQTVISQEWSAAESAARSAAESAARSAADSAAWSAAWNAARSAAWSAAWNGSPSAAWSAAESAAIKRQSEKLIELLEAA